MNEEKESQMTRHQGVTCPSCGYKYPPGSVATPAGVLDPVVESGGQSAHPAHCELSEAPMPLPHVGIPQFMPSTWPSPSDEYTHFSERLGGRAITLEGGFSIDPLAPRLRSREFAGGVRREKDAERNRNYQQLRTFQSPSVARALHLGGVRLRDHERPPIPVQEDYDLIRSHPGLAGIVKNIDTMSRNQIR